VSIFDYALCEGQIAKLYDVGSGASDYVPEPATAALLALGAAGLAQVRQLLL